MVLLCFPLKKDLVDINESNEMAQTTHEKKKNTIKNIKFNY